MKTTRCPHTRIARAPPVLKLDFFYFIFSFQLIICYDRAAVASGDDDPLMLFCSVLILFFYKKQHTDSIHSTIFFCLNKSHTLSAHPISIVRVQTCEFYVSCLFSHFILVLVKCDYFKLSQI